MHYTRRSETVLTNTELPIRTLRVRVHDFLHSKKVLIADLITVHRKVLMFIVRIEVTLSQN